MAPQHINPHDTSAVTVDTSATPEQLLLQRLSQGDTTAFWDLWERYREPLLARRCLQWMGGDQAEAEDALSSACLKAWHKLPAQARDIHNIQGWLCQFLYHHCMDLRRERSRRHRTVEFVDNYARLDADAITVSAEAPDQAVLEYETARTLCRALTLLPLRLRQPAILRFCQELPHRDIAVQLGLTPETVRKRIQQARDLLQEQVQAYLDGDAGPLWSNTASADQALQRWDIEGLAA